MASTAIEWATHVWNPFTGCDRVSPGCAHCYAADVAAGNQRRELGRERAATEAGKPSPTMRYQNDGDPKTSGPGFGFTVHWDKLAKPERFPVGARVFVNSMSDVFHENAPLDAISRLWEVFASRPDVDWLILTKRPERMREIVDWLDEYQDTLAGVDTWPLPNVWLGVTIENRRFVSRADLLRSTPAAVRFISAEPLLGPLLPDGINDDMSVFWTDGYDGPGLSLTGIDWLIVGGESGSRHRRIDADWVRRLCFDAGLTDTAFFFKQWGGRTPKVGGRDLDGRTWDEMPTAVVA